MSAILPLQNPPRIRGGLESIARALLDQDGSVMPESEWRRGVTSTNAGFGETFTAGFGGGSFGAYVDEESKPINDNPMVEGFFPVALGAIYQCEMNAPGGILGDVSQQRAVQLLERNQWSDIARLLATGENYRCGEDVDDPALNPSLQNRAQLPDGYDGVDPGSIRGALQGLLDGVCASPGGGAGWHSDPVFHIPRAWMPHFLGDVVSWDEANQVFRFGPHLVSFDCYPNVAPDAGGTTAADGSEVWIYASMAPQVAISSEIDVALQRTELMNNYKARAERQAIVAFDTYLVMAAKALVG